METTAAHHVNTPPKSASPMRSSVDHDEDLEPGVRQVGEDPVHERVTEPGDEAAVRVEDRPGRIQPWAVRDGRVAAAAPRPLRRAAEDAAAPPLPPAAPAAAATRQPRPRSVATAALPPARRGRSRCRSAASRRLRPSGRSAPPSAPVAALAAFRPGLDDALGEHPARLALARGEIQPALGHLVRRLHHPHESEPQAQEKRPVAADLVGGEPADERALVLHVEELVLHVFPDLVDPRDAEEVDRR